MDEGFDSVDICYECSGYGDNYTEDEDGDVVCVCGDCPYNGLDDECYWYG